MLNLICILFRNTKELPSVRSRLYELGINALLTDWDQHRQIYREPIYRDLNKLHILKLLLKIARTTFEQAHFLFDQRQAEWLIGDYLESFEQAQANSVELQEASTIVLEGIVAHHGLLIERADGIFSFSHLTFHEYFTAWSIHLKQDWQALLLQTCNSQWREVFLLVAEMKPSGDALIRMMEQQILNTVAIQVELRRLLAWVNTRATKAAEEVPYKLFALRAWYLSLNGFNLDEGVESFLISLVFRSYDKHFIDGLLPVILPLKPLLSQLDNLTFSSQQNLFLNWWRQEGKRWDVEAALLLPSENTELHV